MSYLPTIWTFLAGVITVAGLIIAFARVSPDDAKSNLGRWIQASGFPALFGALRTQDVQAALGKLGAILTLIGSVWFGSIVSPYISDWIDPPGQREEKLNAALRERDARVRAAALAEMQKDILQRTGFLKLTDAERWNIALKLSQQSISVGGDKPCEARIFAKINDRSADGLTEDIPRLMRLGSWHVEGGRAPKSVFPDGISVSVASESGTGFTCGYRLSETFEGMGIKPVTFRAAVTTPDLVECKQCVEVILGTTNSPTRPEK